MNLADFNFGDFGLAVLAGSLSTLSPCVLPLLPVILTSAASKHWLGTVALTCGVALSFTAIGLFIATVGFAVGVDANWFRLFAAVVMMAIGVVMVAPALQERLVVGASPASQWVHSRFGGFAVDGLAGQFNLGVLLGAVWSPCVGPTLGAASVLASRGENLQQVAVVMSGFGLGVTLPLLVLGAISDRLSAPLRSRLRSSRKWVQSMLGVVLMAIGAAVITGYDKQLEILFLSAVPEWFGTLATRY
jgi:cytochrome c-type biogenesis protein